MFSDTTLEWFKTNEYDLLDINKVGKYGNSALMKAVREGDVALTNEKIAYQKVTILSGFLAHIIYLRAESLGVGCTGIGAFYDEETKEFLGTQNNILYLLAIGR